MSTANVFIGALQGNADSATAAASLSANPTINGVVFDGTGPITVSTSPGNQLPLTAGAYLTGANYTGGAAVTFDVEADTNNTPNTLAARDGSGVIRATTFAGALAGVTSDAATANNAQTADALTTPRQINGTPFDGTADIQDWRTRHQPWRCNAIGCRQWLDDCSDRYADDSCAVGWYYDFNLEQHIWRYCAEQRHRGRWCTTQARAMSAALHWVLVALQLFNTCPAQQR